MEENKSELYESAKIILYKAIKNVISDNPQLVKAEDIKERTEMLIMLKLASESISDEVERKLEYALQVFDRAFAESYKNYIDETTNVKESQSNNNIIKKPIEEDLEI